MQVQDLFLAVVACIASFFALLPKVRHDSEQLSTVNAIDIRTALPLSETVRCRLNTLFVAQAQDIEGWLQLLPRSVEVEEFTEVVFVLAERQLHLVAQIESLKSRKDAFAILLEEKKQLLADERKRSRESELEKAGLKELNGKLRCEMEQLKKEVAGLNERAEILLRDLERLKQESVGEASLKEAENPLKGKWELEKKELLLRVSELKAALAQKSGAEKEHLVRISTKTEGAVRPANSGMLFIYSCVVVQLVC